MRKKATARALNRAIGKGVTIGRVFCRVED